MSPHTDPGALLKLAENCAKYDFDTVEMVECKWELWDKILEVVEAASHGRAGGEQSEVRSVSIEDISLTPEQLSITNDMIHAWIDEPERYRIAFRNDCKRLLATVLNGAAQASGEPLAWLDGRTAGLSWQNRIIASNPQYVENNGPENFIALYPSPPSEAASPVWWRWRFKTQGHWSKWIALENDDISPFRELQGHHLESGHCELQPLYSVSSADCGASK